MAWLQIASVTFLNSTVNLPNDDQINLCDQNDGTLPMDCERSRISGRHCWMIIFHSDSGIASYVFNELMDFLTRWEGPNMNEAFPYVWHFIDLNIFIGIYFHTCVMPCHLCFLYISPLHCIYHAPSRILAFWVMLSVLCTTFNKGYAISSLWVTDAVEILRTASVIRNSSVPAGNDNGIITSITAIRLYFSAISFFCFSRLISSSHFQCKNKLRN